MLKELKFVQGAVAKKDFLPAMTHFAIEKGTVRSYNGFLALCAPIAFDIDCKPKAGPLVQAINNCGDTIALSMTPAGRLSIRSGKFKAFIECVTEETPHVRPEGERVDFDGAAMLSALKTLQDFIGDDASRPWSTGVLFRGPSAYATNNIIVLEYWTGVHMPFVINIPRAAIKEMIRIDEPPTYAQVEKTSITFHYADQRWVRTQLLQTEWPDLSKLLDVPNDPKIVDEQLYEGLEAIRPFADKIGRVFIKDGVLSTTNEATEGAHFEVPGLQMNGIYAIEMLRLLKGVTTHIDFTTYPKPCLFFGDRLRGAIVGMKPL